MSLNTRNIRDFVIPVVMAKKSLDATSLDKALEGESSRHGAEL